MIESDVHILPLKPPELILLGETMASSFHLVWHIADTDIKLRLNAINADTKHNLYTMLEMLYVKPVFNYCNGMYVLFILGAARHTHDINPTSHRFLSLRINKRSRVLMANIDWSYAYSTDRIPF